MAITPSDVSVVVCTYTQKRWDDLTAAVQSLQDQAFPPGEIIIVVDHNPPLMELAVKEFPQALVVENSEQQGLSGARNGGINAARGQVVAFMDDDAMAAADWVAQLSTGYIDNRVIGVGGAILPMWPDHRPRWFPEEFDWVVGCTYSGLPPKLAPVRNLIGCNMSFRREVFEAVGGFRNGMGRVNNRPVGCEETELCIRASRHLNECVLLYNPDAQVHHKVPPDRARWRYFRDRCYAEGLSKAMTVRMVGFEDGLTAERSYTFHILPMGILRGLKDALLHRRPAGLACAGAITAGLIYTTAGYLKGSVSERLSKFEALDY